MQYNKHYYILKRNGVDKLCIELVSACECPYDKRLFITKDDGKFSLNDKITGQLLKTEMTLKSLKDWFIKGGRKAYNKVRKNNLCNYEQRKADFKRLVEAK